jgi:putative DNA primase/helicase
VRAAEGDARGKALATAAQQLGQLVPAGGLHEGFAKAALEEAAAACGLIRDDGLKSVKKLITDGIKRGKKSPRAAEQSTTPCGRSRKKRRRFARAAARTIRTRRAARATMSSKPIAMATGRSNPTKSRPGAVRRRRRTSSARC